MTTGPTKDHQRPPPLPTTRRSGHGKEATNRAERQQGLETRPRLELQVRFFFLDFFTLLTTFIYRHYQPPLPP